MMSNKLQVNFFYVVLVAVSILTLLVFLPYFQALSLAAIFAVVMYPVHRAILKACMGVENLAAALSVIVTFALIVAPLTFVGFLLFRELQGVYGYVAGPDGSSAISSTVIGLQEMLTKSLPTGWAPHIASIDVQAYVGQVYGWVGSNVAAIASNTLSFAAQAFIFVLGLFFFLRDGERFKKFIVKLSPLNDAYDEKIIKKIVAAIDSVVTGSLLVSVLQGVVLAIGMYLFRLSSPVIWGTVAMFASLLPGLGTGPVVAIVVVMAYFSFGLWPALGMLLWGAAVVGLVDNVVRPVLYERGIKVHSFLILLSIFGGLGFFGPLGFLLGPILLALLVTLIEIYEDMSVARKA